MCTRELCTGQIMCGIYDVYEKLCLEKNYVEDKWFVDDVNDVCHNSCVEHMKCMTKIVLDSVCL